MMRMKGECVLLTMLILSGWIATAAAVEMRDVVYLKDGSVVKGTIVEQVPNKSLKIETADGSLFVYKFDDIEKIAKEAARVAGGQKSPFLAGALSFFVPGTGQFYNEEWGKGAIHLVVAVGGSTMLAAGGGGSVTVAGFALSVTNLVWSVVDAPISASRINKARGYAGLGVPSSDQRFAVCLGPVGSEGNMGIGLRYRW